MAAARRLAPSPTSPVPNPLARSTDKLSIHSSIESSSKLLLDIRETRVKNRQSANASFMSSGSSASTVRGNYSATGYDRQLYHAESVMRDLLIQIISDQHFFSVSADYELMEGFKTF